MLAHLLRLIYLVQLLCGALLGGYVSVQLTNRGAGMAAWFWLPAGALGLPIALQFLTILTLMLRSRSSAIGPLWWRALWGEFKAALLIFMLRQPWPNTQKGVLLPADEAHVRSGPGALPVLLVHGYVCNHRVWDDVARSLRRRGHPVLAIDLEPLFTSIDDYSALIERQVSALQSQTGAQQVVLVGHSMGGLAIRAWLRAYGTQRVTRVVTLGSPHQGTRIAQASMTPNGAQMVWHSDWLQALAASEGAAQRALMRIAITAQDNVVYPQMDQVLPGAQVTNFQGMGHLQMCTDPTVIDWVCQQVDTATAPS